MKKLLYISLLALVVFCMNSNVTAQMTSGDLVGTVLDQTGAAIPNATVTAVNAATQVTNTTKANGQGEYRISNLLAGSYNVTASATGFTNSTTNGLAIDLNKTSTLNLKMPTAGTSSSVEVSTDAAMALDTSSAQLQLTLSNRELSELPTSSIGLGVLNASLLSANVGTSGGIGAGTGPSVGGQRPRANNFEIEGVDNNNKSVTGPLVYIPNDAVGQFTLITNQFSPEFGHSAGGQFNTTVQSGTNAFHGRLYEYFQNRNLNAIDATTARAAAPGVKAFNPRYDDNRYGGQLGGPVLRDKVFFFGNFERHSNGQTLNNARCTPTAGGLSALKNIPGLNATNLAIYEKYTPAAPSQVDARNDSVCGNQATGPQSLNIADGSANGTDIPLGNYAVNAPIFTNQNVLTTSGDWTITPKDSLRLRYIYNSFATLDTAADLPAFFISAPSKYHLIALSEYHTFTTNLTNEVRVGYNRYSNLTPAGNFTFPGVDSFPNLTFQDQGSINVGPDGNAPQTTIQNLYQFTDNVTYNKGKHTITFGFDGRKYISPQSFTQRVRGDYQYNLLSDYLQDQAPTLFGERSTGNFFYYGDQTALYGYGNDTWRVSPKVTLNYGLRYEFTSIPRGERVQSLNAAASVPGLINFDKPKPQYKNFAPRVGVVFSPDDKTSIRAGFGMAYDVLYDNLGILSFPPQFSSTLDVNTTGQAVPGQIDGGSPNFLAKGGLPAGNGSLATFPTLAAQRAATSAYVPNQQLPYAETYSLSLQRVIGSNYTAEVRYLGTRGIHLSTQIRLNKQASVDATHFLPTYTANPGQATLDGLTNTLKSIGLNKPNLIPAYGAAGFTTNITTFGPYSQSNYNALSASIIRRFQHGLQLNAAYTWSKNIDDATADVFSTVLTPRRAQDGQNVSNDYSRSALDHTHRLTIETIYDLPFFQHRNFFLKNLVGNWEVAPIYTYQSPEFGTVQSGVDANLNGDAAGDRTVINPLGNRNLGSNSTALKNSAGTTVAYLATNPNAYYIKAQKGALANAGRNTLPLRPIDDVDATATKRINITERYSVEFSAQAFNVLNHPQFISGSLNQIDSRGDTQGQTTNFLRPDNANFNQPQKTFSSNSRTIQLSGKLNF